MYVNILYYRMDFVNFVVQIVFLNYVFKQCNCALSFPELILDRRITHLSSHLFPPPGVLQILQPFSFLSRPVKDNTKELYYTKISALLNLPSF